MSKKHFNSNKNNGNNITLCEIIFCIILTLIWSAQLIGGVCALIYIPTLIEEWYPILSVLINGFMWIFTISTFICWVLNLIFMCKTIFKGENVSISSSDESLN